MKVLKAIHKIIVFGWFFPLYLLYLCFEKDSKTQEAILFSATMTTIFLGIAIIVKWGLGLGT